MANDGIANVGIANILAVIDEGDRATKVLSMRRWHI